MIHRAPDMHDIRRGFDREGWKTIGSFCLEMALLVPLLLLVGFATAAPVPALAVALFGAAADFVWLPGAFLAFVLLSTVFTEAALLDLSPAIEGWLAGSTSARAIFARIGVFFVVYQMSTLALAAILTIPGLFGLSLDDAMGVLSMAPILLIFRRVWFTHPAPSSEWQRQLPSLGGQEDQSDALSARPRATASRRVQASAAGFSRRSIPTHVQEIALGHSSRIKPAGWPARWAWRLLAYCVVAVGFWIWSEARFGRDHALVDVVVVFGLTGLASGIALIGLLIWWLPEIAAHFKAASRRTQVFAGIALMSAGVIVPAWTFGTGPQEEFFECTMLQRFPNDYALWARICNERRAVALGSHSTAMIMATMSGVGAFLFGVKILAGALRFGASSGR
jgi:hypothetical protein